jgi:hypothetical protein
VEIKQAWLLVLPALRWKTKKNGREGLEHLITMVYLMQVMKTKGEVMGKKQNLCIYCKKPYEKDKGWYSQKGMMWAEGEAEEQGKPYQLFWHPECDPKYNEMMQKIRQEIS